MSGPLMIVSTAGSWMEVASFLFLRMMDVKVAAGANVEVLYSVPNSL